MFFTCGEIENLIKHQKVSKIMKIIVARVD